MGEKPVVSSPPTKKRSNKSVDEEATQDEAESEDNPLTGIEEFESRVEEAFTSGMNSEDDT